MRHINAEGTKRADFLQRLYMNSQYKKNEQVTNSVWLLQVKICI